VGALDDEGALDIVGGWLTRPSDGVGATVESSDGVGAKVKSLAAVIVGLELGDVVGCMVAMHSVFVPNLSH